MLLNHSTSVIVVCSNTAKCMLAWQCCRQAFNVEWFSFLSFTVQLSQVLYFIVRNCKQYALPKF